MIPLLRGVLDLYQVVLEYVLFFKFFILASA